jgi:hypothetical protein
MVKRALDKLFKELESDLDSGAIEIDRIEQDGDAAAVLVKYQFPEYYFIIDRDDYNITGLVNGYDEVDDHLKFDEGRQCYME